MLWILQTNLDCENRRADLQAALRRLSIPYVLAEVRQGRCFPQTPFDPAQPIITNGSVMLSKIAAEQGWKPGSLFNRQFDQRIWSKAWASLCLNANGACKALADWAPGDLPERFFARPALDTKAFNGRVFSNSEFAAIRAASLARIPGSLDPQTPVAVAKARKIGQEHRHYIVNGKAVASSRYKLSGVPNFAEGADPALVAFAEAAAAAFSPAQAFVLDTCCCDDGYFILEPGCICHAGLYKADLNRLAWELDSMAGASPAPSNSPPFNFP